MAKWRNDLNNKINHNKLLQTILDESGYSEMLKNKKDLENENRLENIKELLNAMKEFDNLDSFLEHVALATSLDQDWENEKVNLNFRCCEIDDLPIRQFAWIVLQLATNGIKIVHF